ncbi:MAG: hypothetical protein JW757_10950 [Anaerolineales bacterium]|nr:hypothetical protein [Anaerolineales bacterium]
MFKLIILIQPEIDKEIFFNGWPDFLSHAELMPGLERIVSAPVHAYLTGDYRPLIVHELIFETRPALEKALASQHGVAAGKLLQQITGGAVTLMTAAHMEDSGENLRKIRSASKPREE